MTTKSLHFKWTVSRGRDTYGYNICTLLVDGEKVARCNGGGYDMQGTCLGDWLQGVYQKELVKLASDNCAHESGAKRSYTSKGDTIKVFDVPGFTYTVHVNANNMDIMAVLDGACGFDSMRRIAEAIGIELKWNKESDRYRNHSFYTAIISQ